MIHNFYHGALRPWEAEGKDQWWRTTPGELRSLQDVCSDEDLDQEEVFDSSALTKARLLLQYQPSSIRLPYNFSGPAITTYDQLVNRLSGEFIPGLPVSGEQHPDGAPDVITIYLSSIDNSSHKDGISDQGTYLAWFDHRLALFVRELRELSSEVFENTVFALVADHGHLNIAQEPDRGDVPDDTELAIREELVRIAFGDEQGDQLLANFRQLAAMAQINSQAIYKTLVTNAIEERFGTWSQAMNLLIYVRDGGPEPLDVARRVLGLTLSVEPVGALVRVRERYLFLQRGNENSRRREQRQL